VLVVDTNVLLYAANATSRFYRPCREWLDRQRRRPDAWFLTWSIVYEFLRVSTHPRILPRPWTVSAAWEFVAALLASPGIGLLIATSRHADVAKKVFSELPHLGGNILHDAHTAILMREHGIKQICSLDADFSRFSFLELIDPLRGLSS
jgi:uncharacterized protein